MDKKLEIDIEAIENAKSDGEPYAALFDNEYSHMTEADRMEVDKLMKLLEEKFDFDDDE